MSTGTLLALGIFAYLGWQNRGPAIEKIKSWLPESTGSGTTKLLLLAVAILVGDKFLPAIDPGSWELPSLPSVLRPSDDSPDAPVSLAALSEAVAERVPVSGKLQSTRDWWEFWDTACEAAGLASSPELAALNGQLAAAVGERTDGSSLSTEMTAQKKQAVVAVLATQYG